MKDIIIASVVGAVIGYFTNWLAIKMMFRPHNEIRIFGIRLPFTPGLIPKERYSIAKKLGETVSKHLMTTDVLVGAVYAEETTKNFSSMMDRFIERMKASHKTLGETFIELAGWDRQKLTEKINAAAEMLAASTVKNAKLRGELNTAVTERILGFLKGGGAAEFFHSLRENTAGKKLNEFIFENDLELIKKVVREKTPDIMKRFHDYIEYDFEFGVKLKAIIYKVIDENVHGFTGLFINRDKVYRSIMNGMEDYLGDEESQNALAETGVMQLGKILEMNTEELLAKIPDGILDSLPSKIQELDGFDDRVEELVSKLLDSALSDDFANIMTGIVYKFLNNAVDMEVGVLVEKIEEHNLFDIKDYILRFFDYLIKKCSHYVFDSINFSAIVENQINTFEMSEAEDIILSVVKRELNAITYLGGVLGFIIGLLSTVL